jgi:hypothetical protein
MVCWTAEPCHSLTGCNVVILLVLFIQHSVHTARMAEVLGVVASGISVASLAIQIFDSVQKIQEFCRLKYVASSNRTDRQLSGQV